MPLGFEVVTRESAQSGGISSSTGTAFIVAAASYGPETPTLVRSLGEVETIFGPRAETESQKLYDAASAFFATGGARAYVSRLTGAGSPAAAKEELETAGKTKALIVEAKYKGTTGNKLSVETTATTIKIFNANAELVETFEGATVEALFNAAKGKEAYVVVKEGSNYSTAKSEAVKVLAKKALSGGANPTNNETTTKTAIEAFGKSLGPGQLIAPCTEGVKEAIHKAMGEHCSTNNRVALCDLKEAEKAGTTVATLTGEKGSYATGIQSYMMFFSTACTVQGVTLGTTRTVPASAVVAGLCAQVSRTNNDNQAPAGELWSLAPFVVGFTNTYKQSEMETLQRAGINSFTELNGIPCLFGFFSAQLEETNVIFWQATASRERMHLVWQGEKILGGYLFGTIDGRHHLEAALQGSLQGMVKEHWENNALFGERPNEAGVVNVGEPINTNTTRSKGELNAELKVRISPFADYVKLVIVPTPITESLAQAA